MSSLHFPALPPFRLLFCALYVALVESAPNVFHISSESFLILKSRDRVGREASSEEGGEGQGKGTAQLKRAKGTSGEKEKEAQTDRGRVQERPVGLKGRLRISARDGKNYGVRDESDGVGWRRQRKRWQGEERTSWNWRPSAGGSPKMLWLPLSFAGRSVTASAGHRSSCCGLPHGCH